MTTKQDYLNQGYTEQQIQDALVKKNTAAMSENLGQELSPTSYNVVPNAAVTPAPIAPDVVKNSEAIAQKLGQNYNATTGQFETKQEQPKIEPIASVSMPQATTTQPKTETPVKTQENAPVDYNQYVWREGDVLTNLNEAYNSGSTSPEQIKAFANYNAATPEKKAAVDAFIAGKQNVEQTNNPLSTVDWLFSALTTSSIIPDRYKQGATYEQAKRRADTFNRYSSFTPSQFQVALKNGDIVPWTQEWKDISSSPIVKANLEKAQKLNMINGVDVSFEDRTKADSNNIMLTYAKAMEDNNISPEEWNQLSTTPSIVAKQDELRNKSEKIGKLQAQFDGIESSIENEVKGTNVTKSELAQMVANRRKDLLPELTAAKNDYNSLYGFYMDEKKDSMALLNQNINAYADSVKANNDRENAILKYEMENPSINSSNPIIANNAAQRIIDEENKFARENGINIYTTDTTKAQAYAKANNVSLAEALQKTFIEPRHNSPEYKKAILATQQKNAGGMTDYQRAQLAMQQQQLANEGISYQKDKDGNTVVYKNGNVISGLTSTGWVSWDLSTNPSFEWAWAKNNNPTGIKTSINANTKKLLADAWIEWVEGSSPPKWEGGTYMKFNTIEDGMKAYKLLLTQAWTNDVYSRLKQWVWTANWDEYASSIMKEAGINPNQSIRFDSLSEEQMNALLSAQLKRESPKLYNAMNAPSSSTTSWTNPQWLTVDDYYNSIINTLPAGSKDNKTEQMRIKEQAQKFFNEGLSQTQAMLKYKGVIIKDPNNSELANRLIWSGDNLYSGVKPKDYENVIAKYLNEGKTNEAINYARNKSDDSVQKKFGDQAVNTPDLNFSTKKTYELITLINENKKELWPINGTLNDWLAYTKSKPEFTKINAILQGLQAQQRKYFAGSAVTPTEMEALKNFIGGTFRMNPDNLMTQLDTLRQWNIDRWKTQYSDYSLPIFPTSQWVYTEDDIKKEIEQARKSWVTKEEIKSWLEKEGIPFN